MRRKIFERRMVEYLREMFPGGSRFQKRLAAATLSRACGRESLLKNVDGSPVRAGPQMRRKFEILLDQAKREAACGSLRRRRSPAPTRAEAPGRRPRPGRRGDRDFLGSDDGEKSADRLRAEVREMKTSVMLIMLDKPSASERLKAVAIPGEIQPPATASEPSLRPERDPRHVRLTRSRRWPDSPTGRAFGPASCKPLAVQTRRP